MLPLNTLFYRAALFFCTLLFGCSAAIANKDTQMDTHLTNTNQPLTLLKLSYIGVQTKPINTVALFVDDLAQAHEDFTLIAEPNSNDTRPSVGYARISQAMADCMKTSLNNNNDFSSGKIDLISATFFYGKDVKPREIIVRDLFIKQFYERVLGCISDTDNEAYLIVEHQRKNVAP
jgi:hypothetical protein